VSWVEGLKKSAEGRKRHRLRKLRIAAISAVPRGAQEPAYVRLMKRADDEEPVGKKLMGPKKGEARKDFVARFMADAGARSEFPDEKQRAAAANRQYVAKTFEGGVLSKRLDPEDGVEKMVALTTSVEGHAHLVYLERGDGPATSGTTSHSKMSEGDEHGHSHPWVLSTDGRLVIGEANGHTHDLATLSKAAGEGQDGGGAPLAKGAVEEAGNTEGDPMPETTEKLTTEQKLERTFYSSLKVEDRPGFLAKSAEDRSAAMKAARDGVDGEEVVYKSADGTVFRKVDDPRLAAQARRLDDQDRRIAKMTDDAVLVELHKRADEVLGHLPGTTEQRAALLKAIDAIPDEAARDAALAAVKAGDLAQARVFKSLGTRTTPEETTAEAGLEKLAKSYQEKHPDLSYEQAYSRVLDTPEGNRLSEDLGPAR
jgi:hypothetical protein